MKLEIIQKLYQNDINITGEILGLCDEDPNIGTTSRN